MMATRIFVDANILVAVLNKEYPLFTYAARVLSLADLERFEIVCSPLSLAIAAYFSENKNGVTKTRSKIDLLLKHVSISSIDQKAVLKVFENKRITDIEDGLQYYSALQANCDFIVTEDVGDYFFSEIPVYTAADFLRIVAAR